MKYLVDEKPRSRQIDSMKFWYIRAERTYYSIHYRRYRSISTVASIDATKPQSKYVTLRSPASISVTNIRLKSYRHLSTIDDHYALRSLDHPDHNMSTLKRHIW